MYKDLDIDQRHILLLQLELGDGDGGGGEGSNVPLRAKLVRRSVNSPQQFWAISYVWGDKPTKYAPCLEVINEVNNSRVKVPVTDSLWSCLQYLWRKRVTVPFWADAICINQEDSVEKAIQVRRMGSLYSKAERVILWMGNDWGVDSGAIEWLGTLATSPEPFASTLDEMMKESLEKGGSLIEAFLQRTWFGRTWTIQELIFGRQVMVMSGDSEMEWDIFMDCVVKYEKLMHQAHGDTEHQHQQRFLQHADPAFSLHETRHYYRKARQGDSNRELRYSFLKLIELFDYTRSR